MDAPVVPLLYHLEALERERELRYQQRYEAQQKAVTDAFAASKEALAIKDAADRRALELAREIQTYKDEKANNLREQISSERGVLATKEDLKSAVEKIDATYGPALSYISSQQGRSSGLDKGWAILLGAAALVATIIGIVSYFAK